jgi:hypothetical protein
MLTKYLHEGWHCHVKQHPPCQSSSLIPKLQDIKRERECLMLSLF